MWFIEQSTLYKQGINGLAVSKSVCAKHWFLITKAHAHNKITNEQANDRFIQNNYFSRIAKANSIDLCFSNFWMSLFKTENFVVLFMYLYLNISIGIILRFPFRIVKQPKKTWRLKSNFTVKFFMCAAMDYKTEGWGH